MIDPELYAKIRRLFYVEHWKIGTIAAELGVHPSAVRRAIGSESFNANRSQVVRATLTDPYLNFIQQTLKEYPRLRATRIFEMIRSRGYTGSEVQLRRVVRSLRPTKKEAFLRLQTLPGEEAQADSRSLRASSGRQSEAQTILLRHHPLVFTRPVGRVFL